MDAPQLEDLVTVIGYRPMTYLHAKYAGTAIYVPKVADPEHPFRWLLGQRAFDALVREYAALRVFVPKDMGPELLRRDLTIAERFAAGVSPPVIAAEFGLSRRRVEQLRAELLDRGWIRFAGGNAERVGRGRTERLCGPGNLGTGEVFDKPPGVCERGCSAGAG